MRPRVVARLLTLALSAASVAMTGDYVLPLLFDIVAGIGSDAKFTAKLHVLVSWRLQWATHHSVWVLLLLLLRVVFSRLLPLLGASLVVRIIGHICVSTVGEFTAPRVVGHAWAWRGVRWGCRWHSVAILGVERAGTVRTWSSNFSWIILVWMPVVRFWVPSVGSTWLSWHRRCIAHWLLILAGVVCGRVNKRLRVTLNRISVASYWAMVNTMGLIIWRVS